MRGMPTRGVVQRGRGGISGESVPYSGATMTDVQCQLSHMDHAPLNRWSTISPKVPKQGDSRIKTVSSLLLQPPDSTMVIPLRLLNHEHRAPSSVHRAVEGIVTLTTLGLLVDREALPEAGVEVRHLNGKSQNPLVHLGVGVRLRNGKREGRHVVRKNGRSLRLQLRRNVEVDLQVRGRGRMWVLDPVDGRVTESRKREGLLGQSPFYYIESG
jgi:hypothetical protein